jgi:hypothetical protein
VRPPASFVIVSSCRSSALRQPRQGPRCARASSRLKPPRWRASAITRSSHRERSTAPRTDHRLIRPTHAPAGDGSPTRSQTHRTKT